jgi:hypothetical protein
MDGMYAENAGRERDLGGRAKHDFREEGGTSSRMSEGRAMQELLSRAKQDARAEEARAEQFSVQD